MKGDPTTRGFEHTGKAIFCGKVKHNKKEQGENEAENEIEEDAPDNEVDESDTTAGRKGGGNVGMWKTSSSIEVEHSPHDGVGAPSGWALR